MKKLCTNLLLAFLVMTAIASCQQPPERNGGGTAYQSEAFKRVVNNIEQLAQKSWDKAAYNEIKKNQIPGLKTSSERNSASELLEAEYSKVLVRDAKKILKAGCTARRAHSLLSGMMGELMRYPDVPGLDEVNSLNQKHTQVSVFVGSAVERQANVTYQVAYDSDYENKHMLQAQNYLEDTQLYCKDLKSQLENLKKRSAYAGRRLWHSQDVVKSYLESTDPRVRQLNIAISMLSYEVQDSVDRWSAIMQEHYDELNRIANDEN